MSKSNSKKGGKFGSSTTLNTILIIQLVIMLGLSLFITKTVSSKTRENAIQHMGAISDERAHIIESYVENSEKTLRNFCKASQVRDLLSLSKKMDLGQAVTNQDNEDFMAAQKAAQEYTEKFSNDVAHIEGIWIGSWDTFVLTHTNSAVVGMQTRPDADKQEALHQGMENGEDGLFNTGIMISPASQKQCLFMYLAVYDDRTGDPLGFVGLGIFTDGLIDTLNSIPIRGVENSYYSMADINSNLYIFNEDDESKIHTEIDNKQLSDLCASYKDGSEKKESGSFEYTKGGKKYVSIYTYMPDRGWIVTIDDYKSEVFALTTTMRIYLGIFGVVILGLILVFNLISKRQERINQKLVSTIAKNNMTKKTLNTAMFKDVLTGVDNRVSFSMNIGNVEPSNENPCYFALFNVNKFSEINGQYGNDAGDRILARTAEALTEVFADNTIYRTGSDEFLVVVPTSNGEPADNDVREKVNLAFRQMIAPEKIENVGTIYPQYKVAMGKTIRTVDSSVVTKLKTIMNNEDVATFGMIDCVDL